MCTRGWLSAVSKLHPQLLQLVSMRTVWIASKYFLLKEFSVSTSRVVRNLSLMEQTEGKKNLEKFLDILNSKALVHLRYGLNL